MSIFEDFFVGLDFIGVDVAVDALVLLPFCCLAGNSGLLIYNRRGYPELNYVILATVRVRKMYAKVLPTQHKMCNFI